MDVSLATPAERSLIEGLFQFYAYDFSELEPTGSRHFEPGADGRFPPYVYLDDYWRQPSRVPLIIRSAGRAAGFALINSIGHSGRPVERNMAEFFVMRKHRRGGVGSAAVRTILARYPGVWEIAIAGRNTGALAFWPNVVAQTPGVGDLVTLEDNGAAWAGPILRFSVAAVMGASRDTANPTR